VSIQRVDTPWSGVSTLTFDRVPENMALVVGHAGARVADDQASLICYQPPEQFIFLLVMSLTHSRARWPGPSA
jgi:hypothetical protein